MKQRIRFIINPRAGGRQKGALPALIRLYIDKARFEAEIASTGSEAETLALAQSGVKEGFDIIVAVGGDGTVNNIARHVVGSSSALAVIPMGSGNGLARELQIPTDPIRALAIINQNKRQKVDAGKINDRFFFNVAGVGFDAHVVNLFADSKVRGLLTYTRITLLEYLKYRPGEYEMIIDGKTHHQKAFMIVVANGRQFGNNAYIAPAASINDGRFNITIIEPFGSNSVPALARALFLKRIEALSFVKTYTGREVIIKREVKAGVNIDGEPAVMDTDLRFSMLPLSLNVIVP